MSNLFGHSRTGVYKAKPNIRISEGENKSSFVFPSLKPVRVSKVLNDLNDLKDFKDLNAAASPATAFSSL